MPTSSASRGRRAPFLRGREVLAQGDDLSIKEILLHAARVQRLLQPLDRGRRPVPVARCRGAGLGCRPPVLLRRLDECGDKIRFFQTLDQTVDHRAPNLVEPTASPVGAGAAFPEGGTLSPDPITARVVHCQTAIALPGQARGAKPRRAAILGPGCPSEHAFRCPGTRADRICRKGPVQAGSSGAMIRFISSDPGLTGAPQVVTTCPAPSSSTLLKFQFGTNPRVWRSHR